jgi:AmmeMemoRadiSam system protein B/AmmeMemoRadiSam system protein A
MTKTDRQPAVAGQFYPADKTELTQMIQGFFEKAPVMPESQPLAIIAPHAGYVFSGAVAAAGFRQIDREKQFKHVFIIGSSHTTYFNGALVYYQGDFITPLGKVPVDTLAEWLDKKYNIINNNLEPHVGEHSLEVQLPFLQYWLKKPFSIVPIIVGGESEETSRLLAEALKPFFIEENLFVISTDFSHYPSYADAKFSDTAIVKAVASNSVKTFLKTKAQLENMGTPQLFTAMCGWTSVLTLLNITENNPGLEYRIIENKNSGDTKYGEKDRVVGYCAIEVLKKMNDKPDNTFSLSTEEKKKLLTIARRTLNEYIMKGIIPKIDEATLSPNLLAQAGAFVTLKIDGNLRGCIGNFTAEQPLYKTIQSMTIASSTEDYRFNKVTPEELNSIEIEISVLTPMKKIQSIDEIELGKHGIYIKKGSRAGTFLPQVATETGWTKEEFLGHCAQDKAFIGWEGWKTADVYIYEALVFDEEK